MAHHRATTHTHHMKSVLLALLALVPAAIAHIAGAIHFDTQVGAVALTNLAGDVTGKTSVGAIEIVLAGDRWEGKGIDVATATGAVHLTAAATYSASFDLRTNMGAIVTD